MENELSALPNDYISLVIRQFKKNLLGVIAFWIVIFLFMVAIFAPFLAENKPIAMKYDGKIEWTLFTALTKTDLSLLAIFFFVIVGFISYKIVKSAKKCERGTALRWTLVWIIPLLVVAISLSFLKGEVNIPNFAMQQKIKKANWVVMPLVRWSPDKISDDINVTSSGQHWLGTDDNGRDIMARVIHGTRISLAVGFVATAIAIVIGVIFGALAGFYGGWVDNLISRLIEIIICFPSFFLILTVIAFLPQSIYNFMGIYCVMIVIGIFGWTGVARLVRAEFLRLKSQDFVIAARALGTPTRRIIFRHILPNSLAPVFVSATFGVAGAILTESALSFLGFGVPPPTSSWGQLLSYAKDAIAYDPLKTIWPGLAIFITITSYNLLGDALRDALDPRLKI